MPGNSRPLAMLFLFVSFVGCAHLSPSPMASRLASQPAESREHVYVIFVESPADLGQWGGLPQLSEYFRKCGLCQSYYFNPYVEGMDGKYLAAFVRRIRQDPKARVMLVGWSFGSIISLDAIHELAESRTCIDTMVYLDSWSLKLIGGEAQPNNVGRTVLVYRSHNEFPDGFPCPVKHTVDVCRHLNLPMAPHTVDVLFAEATRLASSVQKTDVPYLPEMATFSEPTL